MLSKDEILNAKDFRTATVEVPEWGGTVTVRSLTADNLLKIEAAAKAKKDDDDRYPIALYCAMSICDESGKRLFADSDAESLGERSITALAKVFQAAVALNATVGEAEKN